MEHTSPDTFPDAGNKFISKYPKANAPTDSMAITASPFTLELFPFFSISIAVSTVIGRMIIILLVKLRTVAMARAPKATCDNPSPIYENLLSTSITPSSEEHSAINVPTIKAYLTYGKVIYKVNFSNILPPPCLTEFHLMFLCHLIYLHQKSLWHIFLHFPNHD